MTDCRRPASSRTSGSSSRDWTRARPCSEGAGNLMKIDRSVVIVTGASSGIGAATARLLAGRGARVVLAARRADRLEALAAELPGALAVTTDVTDPAQLGHLVERCQDVHGRVDVLVNNAGQGLHVPILELSADDLRAVFELNAIAPLVAMQAVVPRCGLRVAAPSST